MIIIPPILGLEIFWYRKSRGHRYGEMMIMTKNMANGMNHGIRCRMTREDMFEQAQQQFTNYKTYTWK